MDNNNPIIPVTPPAPVISPVPTSDGSGNKMIIFFVVGFVAIILVVGGIYMYLNMQQAVPEPVAESIITTPVVPKAEVKDPLDVDLEAINVASDEAEFNSVDQDLQSL